MVLALLQDGGISGSLRGFHDVVEVSQALRANMVAEGRATNACYLDALRLLTPLQQVQVSSPIRRLARARTRCSEFRLRSPGIEVILSSMSVHDVAVMPSGNGQD